MTLADSFQSAVRAIAANKLRSVLTMLGVVIGVGSVIAMIGIGEGTKQKSLENIRVMGTDMITVMPDWRRGGQSGGVGSGMALKPEDVEDLRKLPTVKLISGAVRSNDRAKFGSRSHQTSILGVEPIMAVIRNATKLHSGAWFTEADDALMERKAVLGYLVYDELFKGENAIGATIKIKGQNFEVIGVVDYKGGSGFMNPDDQIYIPLKTAQQRLMGKTNLDMISVQAISTDLMPIAQTQIEDTLAIKRRSAAGENLFRVFNQGEMIQQIQTQTQLLGFLLAGIASVSLLVGGIGIMNIMLVSVTERTREIGLRKAIGAKREGILTQFLLESVVMCVLGGAIGIVLGWLATRVVAKSLQVPPVVNTTAIVMAFGFSVLVGLFFGLYPALRASRLQPIEALRYE
ncbi:MAG TPA: ABC transporter permease [Fimbriimonadaceae bacterium]|nr:ABC transporter permease [Fimbriimonadaceae bacterium]